MILNLTSHLHTNSIFIVVGNVDIEDDKNIQIVKSQPIIKHLVIKSEPIPIIKSQPIPIIKSQPIPIIKPQTIYNPYFISMYNQQNLPIIKP